MKGRIFQQTELSTSDWARELSGVMPGNKAGRDHKEKIRNKLNYAIDRGYLAGSGLVVKSEDLRAFIAKSGDDFLSSVSGVILTQRVGAQGSDVSSYGEPEEVRHGDGEAAYQHMKALFVAEKNQRKVARAEADENRADADKHRRRAAAAIDGKKRSESDLDEK